MTAKHLMQIAALASALGLAGTAVAETTYGTTRSDVPFSYDVEAPSSGAIVTPEDKAAGMGRDDERAGDRGRDVNDDTSALNGNTSNDDGSTFNPWPSNDELSDNPRRSGMDDGASPRYGTPTSPGVIDRNGTSTLNEDESVAARTGSDVQPGDMGPGNVRGQ